LVVGGFMKKEISNAEIMDLIKETKLKAKKRQLATITDKTHLTTEDKFKISICKFFVQYLNENKMKPIDLHKQTGIEKSRISEIVHYKITKFTIDKLLNWLHILSEHSPKIRGHLLLIEETLNVPMLSVKESKELTRTIRKISNTANARMYV
jgi:predicted XRE-type DNA-binding protein